MSGDDAKGVKPAADLVAGQSGRKAKVNSGMKWFAGCGLGCMGLLLVLGVIGWWSAGKLREQQEQFFQKYEAEGYHIIHKEVQDINEPQAGKKLFHGRLVTLKADCPAGVVIVADEGRIDAVITGPVSFFGGRLEVGPAAVLPILTGEAGSFENKGKVGDNQLKVLRQAQPTQEAEGKK